MDSDEKKAKATDLLLESLKGILTVSTVLLAGILAFGATIADGIRPLWYVSLVALVAVSLLCLVNINSLINKVYRGDLDAIMKPDVKIINVLVLVAFAVALGTGGWFVMSTKAKAADRATTIADEKATFIVGENSRVTVEKRNGKVERIVVEPK